MSPKCIDSLCFLADQQAACLEDYCCRLLLDRFDWDEAHRLARHSFADCLGVACICFASLYEGFHIGRWN
jgi:hypothetical protein